MALTIGAVVFDLGGTLVRWPEWEIRAPEKWGQSYDALAAVRPGLPAREDYVRAMREAELAHWRRVERDLWSGTPTVLVSEGFRRLRVHPSATDLLAALDGYACSVALWCELYDDTIATLVALRERGVRLGLLSNTWWAAEWHNADLAAHGLASLLDEIVYTSDLPHSKPYPSVFLEASGRLGAAPHECVMVGDRMIDDVSGALAVGMRSVWKRNAETPVREDIAPSAVIDALAELPPLIEDWTT